jgi:hypothetical protein
MMNSIKFILLLLVLCISGCASGGYNGLCGRITGQEMTVPYIGGKANVDGFACHMGYVGSGKPDYTPLVNAMKDYADSQTTNGKIMTTGPGTITFTPNK